MNRNNNDQDKQDMTQMNLSKSRSVTFTGHRSISSEKRLVIKLRLQSAIIKLYQQGFRNFYCGMAMGFDMLAAEAVLALKERLPEISLTAVIPFRAQDERFPYSDKIRYRNLLSRADNNILLSENYYRGCLLRRNDFMLEQAAQVVAFYDGSEKGGTFYTCKHAKALGIPVLNIF